MSASLWFLSAALVLTGPNSGDSPGRSAANEVHVDNCIVKFIDVVEVAAQEAGLLTEVSVREGSEVKRDDKLAQINDSKVQAAKKVAQAEHEVAMAEATNDISVRYASKAADVAKFDYIAHLRSEKKVKGSTPEAELKKLELTWQKGVLEIEKAQLELDVAKLTAKAKEAAVEAADDDIHRRKVTAQIDAMVVQVERRAGEWVNPGDMILRLVRMDKIRVQGTVRIEDVRPSQVIDHPVTVTATLTGRRTVELPGRIVFVAPELQHGKYLVFAEVENREERGAWVLLDGMNVEMKVDAGMAEKAKTPRR
jgi:multidrug efflux pump subunit AcrA (membrane-fusion protein)